jgi:integral membrane protein
MSDVDVQAATPVARKPRDLSGALLRYRIMAYIVGTGLVILICVGLPLQFAANQPDVAYVVGFLHGWLFIVYLILTFDLARRARWNLIRVGFVAICGTVPFLSFYAERRVTRWVREDQAASKLSV